MFRLQRSRRRRRLDDPERRNRDDRERDKDRGQDDVGAGDEGRRRQQDQAEQRFRRRHRGVDAGIANVVGITASTPYITFIIVLSLLLGAHGDQTEKHLVALGGEPRAVHA